MNDKMNKLIKGILVFLLYILVPYVLDMFLPGLTKSNSMELLYRFMFMFLLLLFYGFIYRDDLAKDFKDLKKNFKKIAFKGFIYFIVMIAAMAVSNGIILFLFPKFEPASSNIISSLMETNTLLMVFYVFVISLFTEQIVFRKVFKDILDNKYFFIIFSSLIYGLFQIGYNVSSTAELISIVPYFCVGVILSSSYEKTNNMFTPCLVYLFYDLFILLGVISGL